MWRAGLRYWQHWKNWKSKRGYGRHPMWRWGLRYWQRRKIEITYDYRGEMIYHERIGNKTEKLA